MKSRKVAVQVEAGFIWRGEGVEFRGFGQA